MADKSWDIAGQVTSIAKTQINEPVEDVFSFALGEATINSDVYPDGCDALGSGQVLYVARDAPFVDAIVQIVCVAFAQSRPLKVKFDRPIICTSSPENGRARVLNVEISEQTKSARID